MRLPQQCQRIGGSLPFGEVNSRAWLWLCVLSWVSLLGTTLPCSAEDFSLDADGLRSGRRLDSRWSAGAEAFIAKPRFSSDWSIRRTEEDLAGNARVRDQPVDWDFTASPRVWLRYESRQRIGLQATWWSLDSDANGLSSQPPANGFGELAHPDLHGVDLFTVVPAERLTAAARLDMDVLDLEVTRRTSLGTYDWGVAAGLRRAEVERWDRLQRFNAVGDLAGTAAVWQETSGWGPSVHLFTQRDAFDYLQLTAGLRTSLLFVDAERRLSAVEDLDLPTTFSTSYESVSEELLPTVTVGFGGSWQGRGERTLGWSLRFGFEAQWWRGVGSLADETADLSLLGISLGAGYQW